MAWRPKKILWWPKRCVLFGSLCKPILVRFSSQTMLIITCWQLAGTLLRLGLSFTELPIDSINEKTNKEFSLCLFTSVNKWPYSYMMMDRLRFRGDPTWSKVACRRSHLNRVANGLLSKVTVSNIPSHNKIITVHFVRGLERAFYTLNHCHSSPTWVGSSGLFLSPSWEFQPTWYLVQRQLIITMLHNHHTAIQSVPVGLVAFRLTHPNQGHVCQIAYDQSGRTPD